MPIVAAEKLYAKKKLRSKVPLTDNLLEFLPPAGTSHSAAKELYTWLRTQPTEYISKIALDPARTELLLPVARPPKLLLLAGNYADHIREDGSKYEERKNTFPYVFMKPPSTTLRDPCSDLHLPDLSPHYIDWELELAAVIGIKAKNIPEKDALTVVAGYTVLNDISDRRFRPNPQRKSREWDKFFDWMHGKWHDGFAPCGPCITSADDISDPQSLQLRLELNGELRQCASTLDQIFPLASVIAFISSFVTLEPGDIISTGTPAGVGSTTGTYLKPGDVMVASISGIGSLTTRVHDK